MTKVSKKSTDPRVLRTRKMLREALFALLDEKHFDAVTVLEITEKAGLNATTFYLHYEDKWDLLSSVVSELRIIVDEQPQAAFATEEGEAGATNMLEHKLFKHIEQYHDFYRLMLGKHGVASVRHALQEEFRRIVRVVLQQLPPSVASVSVPDDLVEHYLAGAYVAVVEWWVTQREPAPSYQLARWMENLWQFTMSSEMVSIFKPYNPFV
jgi:AcrR family transcriptional regulator